MSDLFGNHIVGFSHEAAHVWVNNIFSKPGVCGGPVVKMVKTLEVSVIELSREKTNNVVTETGPTQIRLYSHRSRLEA